MRMSIFLFSIILLFYQAQKGVASVNFSVSKEIGLGNLNASSDLMKEMAAGIPIMNKDKIQPMCVSAADELFKELEGSLTKVVKIGKEG